MADFPYSVFDPLSPLANLPMVQIARNARNAACQLWNEFPDFMEHAVSQNPFTNLYNPLFPIMCDRPDDPAPATPAPPFSGGQCCTAYEVTTLHTVGGVTTTNYTNVYGKVKGLSWYEVEGDPGLINGGWELVAGGDCPGTTERRYFLVGTQNGSSMPQASIVSIRRLDGLPDDCGSVPPSFGGGQPPPDRLNFNIDVQVGGVNVSVPVSINIGSPTIGINFRPELNVQVGGINIIFDVGGVNFNFNGNLIDPDFNPFPDPRPPDERPDPFQPTPVNPPLPDGGGGSGGGGGGDCPDVNLQPVLNAIAALDADVEVISDNVELLLDCDRCDRPRVERCQKVLVGTGQSLEVPISSEVAWVGVELTTIPVNAKSQWGVVAPDVFYAGWHSFGGAGSQGERTPIAYEKNVYPVDEGVSLFSFTLQSGYTASCFVYLKPED